MPPVPNWPGAWWWQRFVTVWNYVTDLFGSQIEADVGGIQYLEAAFGWLG